MNSAIHKRRDLVPLKLSIPRELMVALEKESTVRRSGIEAMAIAAISNAVRHVELSARDLRGIAKDIEALD